MDDGFTIYYRHHVDDAGYLTDMDFPPNASGAYHIAVRNLVEGDFTVRVSELGDGLEEEEGDDGEGEEEDVSEDREQRLDFLDVELVVQLL